MKETDQVRTPFRNLLVCYDGNKNIGWMTPQEYNVLRKTAEINWINVKTKTGMQRFQVEKKHITRSGK